MIGRVDAAGTHTESFYAPPKTQVAPADAPADQDAGKPRKTALHRVGQLLVLCALLVPVLMATKGRISSYIGGELIGAGLANWALYGGVAWLITRKRSPQAKGIGALLAGLIVLGSVLVVSADKAAEQTYLAMAMQEMREALDDLRIADQGATELPKRSPLPEVPQSARHGRIAFVCDMADQARRNASQTVRLNRKFAALDLVSMLKPERITSAAGLRVSRDTIGRYRAAVAERGAIARDAMAAGLKVIERANIAEADRASTKKAFDDNRTSHMKSLGELERANLAAADSIEAILDLAQRNLGGIVYRGGRLIFRAQPVLDEYRRLVANSQEAGQREEAVLHEVQQAVERRLRAAADNLAPPKD
jgi:hypothetical protein